MNAPGTVLVWICACIVALPLSPCAFFTGAHCRREQAAKADLAPAPARSCCAGHNEPARPPSQPHRKQPCPSDCCRTSPIAPTSEKLVLASQPVALFAVPPQFGDSTVGGIAPSAIAAPQPLSLHILHCQWRC
ncbi:MAG: hypothetical protein WD063_10680 [Pirellulales bacterium]